MLQQERAQSLLYPNMYSQVAPILSQNQLNISCYQITDSTVKSNLVASLSQISIPGDM